MYMRNGVRTNCLSVCLSASPSAFQNRIPYYLFTVLSIQTENIALQQILS